MYVLRYSHKAFIFVTSSAGETFSEPIVASLFTWDQHKATDPSSALSPGALSVLKASLIKLSLSLSLWVSLYIPQT